MKRTVIVKFEFDTNDYFDTEDSEDGAVDLVEAMLYGDADFPGEAEISCGNAKRDVKLF